LQNVFNSYLAPRKIGVILSISIKQKLLSLARKANKNNVALSRIFLVSTVFKGEVQDIS
jgi:hypothetical protein